MPWVNTAAMQRHLGEIAAAVPEGRHAVVVADRAGWHLTPQLKLPANLSLLPLPAAAPELNPAEQVWEQLRQNDDVCLRSISPHGSEAHSAPGP
jgi:hypothetical protein